ncbi:hypothetical protein [Nocardia camponoti]|uniref:Transglutaminase-like domain-containing protein n=1 Tax=Nocardia camponoti TaxID=1616106 RepID=A0A917QQI4_9NOCA|nr:hypothetical protein [Nocardia camponoti]GGK63176.1 hypothetical protein GCM10011591_39310 [Nocardia camponoti]
MYSAIQDVVGSADTIRSPALREIVVDTLQPGPRYARVPIELSLDEAWMAKHNLVDCRSATRTLSRMIEARGYRVRECVGWLAGPVASEHAWLEVEDDDGAWKSIDIAFHVLAQLLLPDQVKSDVFLGSKPDRLLRSECPLDSPLVEHVDCVNEFSCRTVATARLS